MIDDGVVKYSLEFSQTNVVAKEECEKIEEIREDLFALGLIGAYSNGIGYGNISVRYDDSSAFVITATQTGDLPKLEVSDYSLVEKVNFETFTTTAKGVSKPSSEAITHACIYELDSNINAVIHIHNEQLWNFMLDNEFLSTNDTPYGTPEMVQDVRDIYKNIDPLNSNAFVMKGHFEGIVTFGTNLKQAKQTLYEIVQKALS